MWISRKERAAEREMFLEAIRAVTSSVERQLEVMRSQMSMMEGYMAFLYADQAPTARVMRDEDEFQMELEREKAREALISRWPDSES